MEKSLRDNVLAHHRREMLADIDTMPTAVTGNACSAARHLQFTPGMEEEPQA